MASAEGQATAQRLRAVGASDVQAAEPTRVIAKLPDIRRGVRVRAARGPHARVPAHGNLVRDEVDHAAEGGGAAERRSPPLHALDAPPCPPPPRAGEP